MEIFFPKTVCRHLFACRAKFGEIDPRCLKRWQRFLGDFFLLSDKKNKFKFIFDQKELKKLYLLALGTMVSKDDFLNLKHISIL